MVKRVVLHKPILAPITPDRDVCVFNLQILNHPPVCERSVNRITAVLQNRATPSITSNGDGITRCPINVKHPNTVSLVSVEDLSAPKIKGITGHCRVDERVDFRYRATGLRLRASV
jgi:hypothetical protein